ncbi:ANTAR domain-containing protein [Modestobacter lacusdianchii]
MSAGHGAVALAGAQHEEHLRVAVAGRDLIGPAKAGPMERYEISAGGAFRLLVGTSSRTNRELVDIAEQSCATGALPGAE